MKTVYLSFLLGALALPAFAQFPPGGGPPGGFGGGQRPPQQPAAIPGTANDPTPRGNSKITGYIVDSAVTKAVEFASVALYTKATNKAVDGAVADEKGKFTLNRVAPGDYKLLITFIGYATRTIDNLTVVRSQDLDLGVIKLSPQVKTLDEVTVTGQRALVEEKVDRLIYNAEKDVTAKGGDATEILRKVPLLSVDLDGNVQLRGNSNIRVLINNKPSTIVAQSVADALKQIPADQIKTVEVITSPSARYDAEGSGGIINIITKKNTLQGMTLNLDTGVGNRGANLGLNGSYRKGKMGINLSGFGRANYNVKTRLTNDQTSVYTGGTVRTLQVADGLNRGMFGRYNLSWDYDLDKNQSLTASLSYGTRGQINTQNFDIRQFQNSSTIASNVSGRNVDSRDVSGTVDFNLDYLRIYKPQQEWSMSAQFSRNDRVNNFDAELLNGIGNFTGIQKNLNNGNDQEITLQTDYQTPIKTNQLIEFGAKGILRKVLSDYRYELASSPTGEFLPDPRRPSGSLDYDQNVAAGYLSYTFQTKSKFTVKAGARYEYTFIDASTREGGALFIPDYSNLVPSLNISKAIKGKTYKLAYNRRIQRPGIRQLNPNFNAANPQNISVGNPTLRPELTDNVEFSWSSFFNKTYLNFATFARFTGNSIETVRIPSDTLRGAIINTFQNIGKQQDYGLNVFGNVNVTQKWQIGGGIDLFYRFLNGLVPGANGLSQSLSNRGWNYGGRLNTSLTFKNGWAAQAFGFMRGRQIQLQGFQGGFLFYSAGVRKEFKNKKGSIGVAAENFLMNSFKIRTEVVSPALSQFNTMEMFNRGVRMTFSYQIGKMTMNPQPRRRRGINNDDVKSGGDDGGGGGGQQQQTSPAPASPGGMRPGGGGGFRPGGGGRGGR
jgi:outer membrane receptor protein involved in Fe transport